MKKIDVCINVYGKPYQTIVTLKSLLNHSAQHIDKIYLIEEVTQPSDYNFELIRNSVNYENLIRFIPKNYLSTKRTNLKSYYENEDYKLSLRYEYGLNKTDKTHMLLIHNDVLFQSDIVGEFLKEDENLFGIGSVGQCWNCPLFYEKMCDGEKLKDNLITNFNYETIMNVVNRHPRTRISKVKNRIDNNNPLPMPECRINEWCMLINVNQYREEVINNKSVSPFGGYFILDIGDEWFRQMVNKGYKFKNFEIYKYVTHAYFSNNGNGHSALFNIHKYQSEENLAKEYYEKNYK